MVITFCLIVAGWIIFRAENLWQAYSIFKSIFTYPFFGSSISDTRSWCYIAVLIIVEWQQRENEHPFSFRGDGLLGRYRLAR